MCAQRRLRSAWACAQSDQSLRCPHEESLGPEVPIERTAKTLIRLGGFPGWFESSLGAQSFCWFCNIVAHIQPNAYYLRDKIVAVSLNDDKWECHSYPNYFSKCNAKHIFMEVVSISQYSVSDHKSLSLTTGDVQSIISCKTKCGSERAEDTLEAAFDTNNGFSSSIRYGCRPWHNFLQAVMKWSLFSGAADTGTCMLYHSRETWPCLPGGSMYRSTAALSP